MFRLLIICILSNLSLVSCRNDFDDQKELIQDVLPGRWEIESIFLPKYGLGRSIGGKLVFVDTLLTNVGAFEIPTFDADRLNLNHSTYVPLPCITEMYKERFAFRIDYMCVNDEFFVALRREDTFELPTILDDFVRTSHIFTNNYFLIIKNSDHITLDDRNQTIIKLKRF